MSARCVRIPAPLLPPEAPAKVIHAMVKIGRIHSIHFCLIADGDLSGRCHIPVNKAADECIPERSCITVHFALSGASNPCVQCKNIMFVMLCNTTTAELGNHGRRAASRIALHGLRVIFLDVCEYLGYQWGIYRWCL